MMKYSNLTDIQKRDYVTIIESNSFDYVYYTNKYNIDNEINPIIHFLVEGVNKGYNPSPDFDTSFYLENNKDVRDSGMNPFVHYLKHGKRQHRIPKLLSSSETRKLKLSDDNVIDYLTIVDFGEFDEKFYKKNYKLGRFNNPIVHYVEVGVGKGCNPSPDFDTSFYLENNKDVRDSGMNPFIHYLKYGKIEHRIPKLLSSSETRKLKLSDDNVIDYLTIVDFGEFDEKFYKKNYKLGRFNNPIVHYVEVGVGKGCNPSPDFDTSFYLENNKDVRDSGMNPFIHYLKYGRRQKRKPKK